MTDKQKQIDRLVPHIVQGLLSNEYEMLEMFGSKKKKKDALNEFAGLVYDIAEALVNKKDERVEANDKLNKNSI